MSKKYEHENHRSRMRDRFMRLGADRMSDEELLEMLLYYSIPRVDTAPMAKRLLDAFGSYAAVLDASDAALKNVYGIGQRTVDFLGFVRTFLTCYKRSGCEPENHNSHMRDASLRPGTDDMSDEELLGILLRYANPRVNTAPMVNRLLDTFGSYAAVLDASDTELKNVEGIGKNTVDFLNFVRTFLARYKRSGREERIFVKNPSDMAEYVRSQIADIPNEALYVLIVSGDHEIVYGGILCEGNENSVEMNIRRIAELCITMKADRYVIAHNHPSGIALPSKEDLRTSLVTENALMAMGFNLIDHFIFEPNDYVSFYDSGMVLSRMSREQIATALYE